MIVLTPKITAKRIERTIKEKYRAEPFWLMVVGISPFWLMVVGIG